jgi:hypothetical protein
MPMNDKHISKLEAHLERLVENAFASLFRKSVNAHDMAIKLARSMVNGLHLPAENDTRPIAPDRYIIQLNPRVHEQLQRTTPQLAQVLSQHLVELATEAEYRLLHAPQVTLVAQREVDPEDLEVLAEHSDDVQASTAMMKPIDVSNLPPPPNPQLVIGEKIIPLTEHVINIGRSVENTIMVEDVHVSRHHVQLRLRFGVYTLFDADSKSGTFVNNVQVREHRLRSGDVIRIGNTQLIFMVDDPKGRNVTSTDIIFPIDFKDKLP